MIRTLHSGAKDTTAAAAKDRCCLAKGRVIDAEEIVHLKEEREQIDAVKDKKAKNREKKKEVAAAAASETASSSKGMQKKDTGTRKAPLSLLSDGEENEGELLEDDFDSGSEIVEEEDCFVDVDDDSDAEGTEECRILRLEAAKRPPVVTRSGRVVKSSHLAK